MKKRTLKVFLSLVVIGLFFIGCPTDPAPEPDLELPAPTKVTVEAVTTSTVQISWTPVPDAKYYVIQRSTDSTWTDYVLVTESITGGTEYTVKELASNTVYYFKVGAKIASDKPVGKLSDAVTVLTTGSSDSSLISITVSGQSETSIKITWTTVADASQYKLYRSTVSSSGYQLLTMVDAPATEYLDTSLASGIYYYKVSSVNGSGIESASSNYSYGRTLFPSPANLGAVVHGRVITLSWDAVNSTNYYYIYGAFTSSGTYTQIGSISNGSTAFNVASMVTPGVIPLEPSTTYYFKVSARDGVLSEEVSATTGP